MRVRLNGTPGDIVVIVTYMPTTDHDDEEVETVYEQVEDVIRRGRGDDYVIVVSDLNAVVGAESEEDVTMGEQIWTGKKKRTGSDAGGIL